MAFMLFIDEYGLPYIELNLSAIILHLRRIVYMHVMATLDSIDSGPHHKVNTIVFVVSLLVTYAQVHACDFLANLFQKIRFLF